MEKCEQDGFAGSNTDHASAIMPKALMFCRPIMSEKAKAVPQEVLPALRCRAVKDDDVELLNKDVCSFESVVDKFASEHDEGLQ